MSSFYLDIVFFHEKITPQTNEICGQIFNQLNTIQQFYIKLFNDHYVNYYLFELSPSPVRLLTIASSLISHPFQRDNQSNLNSKIDITVQTLTNLINDYENELREMSNTSGNSASSSTLTTNTTPQSSPSSLPIPPSNFNSNQPPSSSSSSSPIVSSNWLKKVIDREKKCIGYNS